MKHLILLWALISGPLMAQHWDYKAPDYSQIEKNIGNKNGEFYYPTLFNRYRSGDTTLSLEQKRHVYYGYTFQKKYSPYGRTNFSDSLNLLLQQAENADPDFQKIMNITDSILTFNPFDLKALNFRLYSAEQLADSLSFNLALTQYRSIIDVLMSSGNGVYENSAFYVIYTEHEYALLNILGFRFGGKQSLIGQNDYLSLDDEESAPQGLYFNVSACLNHLNRMLDN